MGRWEEGIFLGMNPCPQTLLMSGSVHVLQFLFLDRRDANSLFSKMPFYQMLCITAHYNEYVRITVPFI